MSDQGRQPTSHHWGFQTLVGIILFLLFIFGLGVFVRIVFWDPTIGTVVSETEALTRANERLLEMVKWTISTILLVGGGLIGLNWYQHEKRVDERLAQNSDLLRKQIEDQTLSLNRQIDIHDKWLERARGTLRELQAEVSDIQIAVNDSDLNSAWSLLFADMDGSSDWIGRNTIKAMQNPLVTQRVKRNVLGQLIAFSSLGSSSANRELYLGHHLSSIINEANLQGFKEQAEVLAEFRKEIEAEQAETIKYAEAPNDPDIP